MLTDKRYSRTMLKQLFTDMYTEGLIVPLHTNGDIDEPSNYRGITLLSTFGKLFTKIINERLNVWAEIISCLHRGTGRV